MKAFIFLFLFSLSSLAIFPQNATKQDIQMLMQQIDKRFEQVDKRFEQVDKRFEQMREDMNKRFEQVDKRFEQVDKRFEQMREDMNKRFELITHIMYWIIAILSALILPLYFLIWKQHRKPDILQIEQQIYQSEPEIKARVYLHLKKQAEKYKTPIS